MTNTTMFYVLIALLAVVLILLIIPWAIKLGKTLFKKTNFSSMGESTKIRLVRQLDEATAYLSKHKIGAIITIVNKDSIYKLRTDGEMIDSKISSNLIIALFSKSSPLHDGAIILDSGRITYAGTYYKITNRSINNKYGARHRAAMGISEQSDALTIVVSEETGKITFAKSGTFTIVNHADFQERLIEFLG